MCEEAEIQKFEEELDFYIGVERELLKHAEKLKFVPDGWKKKYTFGKYGDVVVYKYDGFVVVWNMVTNTIWKFRDKEKGFMYARTLARRYSTIGSALS